MHMNIKDTARWIYPPSGTLKKDTDMYMSSMDTKNTRNTTQTNILFILQIDINSSNSIKKIPQIAIIWKLRKN